MSGITIKPKASAFEEETYNWQDHPNAVPSELLMHIFSFLPQKDQLCCRLVCNEWQQTIDRMPNLWLSLAERVMKTSYRCPPFDSIRNFQAISEIRENEIQGRFIKYENLGDRSFCIDDNGCKYLAIVHLTCVPSKLTIVNLLKNLLQTQVPLAQHGETPFQFLTQGIAWRSQGDNYEIVDFRNPLSIQRYALGTVRKDSLLVGCFSSQLIFNVEARFEDVEGLSQGLIVWDNRKEVWVHPFDRSERLLDYFPVMDNYIIKVFSRRISVIDSACGTELQSVDLPARYSRRTLLTNGDIFFEVADNEDEPMVFYFVIGSPILQRMVLPSFYRLTGTGWITCELERPFSDCGLKAFSLLNRESIEVVNFPLGESPTEGPSGIDKETLFSNSFIRMIFNINSHEVLFLLDKENHPLNLLWNHVNNSYKILDDKAAKNFFEVNPHIEHPRDYTFVGEEVATLFEEMANEREIRGKIRQVIPYNALSDGWKSFYKNELLNLSDNAKLPHRSYISEKIKAQALRQAAERVRNLKPTNSKAKS